MMIFSKSAESKRLFLRIPIKSQAQLSIDDIPYAEIRLSDVSTNGLSFFIKGQKEIPGIMDIHLRLSPSGRLIKIKVEVRNTTEFPEGERVGCRFLEIREEDRKLVNSYILGFIGIGFVRRAVNFAAFLCVIDASWRLLAYTVNRYYLNTGFGMSLTQPEVSKFYALIICSYAVFSFISFMFSAELNHKEKIPHFLLSIFFLIPGSILLIIKNISYWKFALWEAHYLLINVFLVVQLVLACYVIFSIFIGIFSLKKVNLIMALMRNYIPSGEK